MKVNRYRASNEGLLHVNNDWKFLISRDHSRVSVIGAKKG